MTIPILIGMSPKVRLLFAAAVAVRGRDIEDRSTATVSSAPAQIELLERFGDPARRREMIVVGQLFTLLDGALRKNKDPTLFVEDFAIWIAGVIDEASVIPPDTGIDSGHFIDREEKGMMALHRFFIVPLQFQIRTDPLPYILDDLGSLGDLDESECSPPLNT